jgi:hypothetical protein
MDNNEDSFRKYLEERPSYRKLYFSIYFLIVLLLISAFWLAYNSTHWYYSLWGFLAVVFIPKNVLILVSKNKRYYSAIPSLEFPPILNNLYGKTISNHYDMAQDIGRFMETPAEKFFKDTFSKVILPISKIIFWLYPYYNVFG